MLDRTVGLQRTDNRPGRLFQPGPADCIPQRVGPGDDRQRTLQQREDVVTSPDARFRTVWIRSSCANAFGVQHQDAIAIHHHLRRIPAGGNQAQQTAAKNGNVSQKATQVLLRRKVVREKPRCKAIEGAEREGFEPSVPVSTSTPV